MKSRLEISVRSDQSTAKTQIRDSPVSRKQEVRVGPAEGFTKTAFPTKTKSA